MEAKRKAKMAIQEQTENDKTKRKGKTENGKWKRKTKKTKGKRTKASVSGRHYSNHLGLDGGDAS